MQLGMFQMSQTQRACAGAFAQGSIMKEKQIISNKQLKKQNFFQIASITSSLRQRLPICQCSSSDIDTQQSKNNNVTVAVAGSTGYIGKFVVKEFIDQGYNTIALAREQSGIGGKNSKQDVIDMFPGGSVEFTDVQNVTSLEKALPESTDVVVCCLASRTGGVKDSWAIDYQATANLLQAARNKGAKHFILLSAICVQKPLLAFQQAKLKFEQELQAATDITHSIVRPTAFFKSLAPQVEIVQQGAPFVMFGDGYLASCKPISEADLAKFMVSCVDDPDKQNAVLPIGGPGGATSAKEQGEMIFRLAEKKRWFLGVPVVVMDAAIGLFDSLAKVFPQLEDSAEFAKIGKYYATESMLVWDAEKQVYSADATPEYGETTLEQFFEKCVKEGMEGQELGDQAVLGIGK